MFKLVDCQSDADIASLVAFSAEHWREQGPWPAECFRSDERFPLKLELSSVLMDTSRAVRGVFIVSKQKEKYYPDAESEFLYIHKIVIDPRLRGGSRVSDQDGNHQRVTINGLSLFRSLWNSAINDAFEKYGLSSQVLSVEPDNTRAIEIYTNTYEFEVLEIRSCGKLLMGRGIKLSSKN